MCVYVRTYVLYMTGRCLQDNEDRSGCVQGGCIQIDVAGVEIQSGCVQGFAYRSMWQELRSSQGVYRGLHTGRCGRS